MLNVKKLQAIRDKILGVTPNYSSYGDLNSVVYLQQILDALNSISGVRRQGNLNEKIYLQKICNAILGVADGQFGSLSNSIYLQQIVNAFNGVTNTKYGSLSENTYLDLMVAAARPLSAFTPTGIAGLKMWVDFSDATKLFQDAARTIPIGADGNAIGGVADKSGTGNHPSQAVAGNRPIYKTGIQNGRSIARFTGGSSHFLAVSPAALQALTIVAAYKPTSMAAYSYLYGKMGGGGNRGYVAGFATTGELQLTSYIGGAAKITTSAAGAVVNNNPYILSFLRKTGTQTLYKNATSIGSGTDAGVYDNSTLAGSIGAGFSTGVPTIFCTGDYMELFLYDSYLALPDLQNLITYLNSKWVIY